MTIHVWGGLRGSDLTLSCDRLAGPCMWCCMVNGELPISGRRRGGGGGLGRCCCQVPLDKTGSIFCKFFFKFQNATSKAMSSEIICNSSLERLKVLETQLKTTYDVIKMSDVSAPPKDVQISNHSQATTNEP